jgi:transposase
MMQDINYTNSIKNIIEDYHKYYDEHLDMISKNKPSTVPVEVYINYNSIDFDRVVWSVLPEYLRYLEPYSGRCKCSVCTEKRRIKQERKFVKGRIPYKN